MGNRQLVDAFEFLQRGADAQRAFDLRLLHGLQDLGQLGAQFGEVQVAMGIDEHIGQSIRGQHRAGQTVPGLLPFELKDALVPELKKGEVDFVCLNFANGDMVGHTGIMEAAIKACEAVDKCVEKVITTAIAHNYTVLVIADHGNCETMINPDGSPNTAHTTNPVPFIVVDKDIKSVHDGVLGDIAPTILELMGTFEPAYMV